MAAIAVPLIATLAPTIIPLVVQLVDKLFGINTGAVKLPTATGIVSTIATGLVQTGQASGPVPATDALMASVQAVVDQLNKAGVLKGTATVIGTPAPAIGLTQAETLSLVQTAMKVLDLALPKLAA